MPQFGIMLHRKLKSLASIRATQRHNRRAKRGPRDLTDTPWDSLAGSGDLVADCRALWPEKIRKNAVLAVEIVLTASPVYFRPNAPGAAGTYDFGRYEAFEEMAWSFLQDHFPGLVVDCVAHFSETTPHLHAIVVPLIDGKLNAREMFFGSPKKLAAWQSAWGEACAPLGLGRGVSSLITGRKHHPLPPVPAHFAPAIAPQKPRSKPFVPPRRPGL